MERVKGTTGGINIYKKKQATAGHPKTFKNGEELCKLFDDFCRDIVSSEYDRIPSQSEFCRWLEQNYKAADRRTIYNSLNKYFPAYKKRFETLQSDLITQGAMLNKYQPTMSIFVLKNWCKWADKPSEETENSNKEIAESIKHLAEAISKPTKERKVEDFE